MTRNVPKNLDAAIGLVFRAFVCRNNDIGVALIDANTSYSFATALITTCFVMM